MNEKSLRYIGWSQVVVAALAMVATLPGRTMGLGMITEPLLKDLQIDRSDFARLNGVATLVGALFCLPIGGWIDRIGVRLILPTVLALLGVCVCLLSEVQTFASLLILVLLTRGVGQSALSVVSISIVGKWFNQRLAIATAVYSVLLSLGFAIAFGVIGLMIKSYGWRWPWLLLGISLLLFAAISAFTTRNWNKKTNENSSEFESVNDVAVGVNLTLREALRTPAFWIFGGAASLFGLVVSGMSLFNQSILSERGFDTNVYYQMQVYSPLVGLVSQLVGGALAQRWSMQRLMTIALAIYAVGLVGMTRVSTLLELCAVVTLLAISGGIITVIFFAIWRRAFGRQHLGHIQGAGQMMTVVASAAGPLVFAECFARTGSYALALYSLAGLVVVFCMGASLVSLPSEARAEPAFQTAIGA